MTRALTTPTGRRLVSVREAAKRLDIPTQSLYQARARGTIEAALGADVPEGVWFDEEELTRWVGSRKRGPKVGPSLKRRQRESELKGPQQVFVATAVGS